MPSHRASSHITATAILPVTDMTVAVAFYRRLGFGVEAFDPTYAWVVHGGHELLHLRLVADSTAAHNASSCYLHVADADAWRSEWTAHGVDASAVVDEPWGMREFSVTDPSGNLIRVGHNL